MIRSLSVAACTAVVLTGGLAHGVPAKTPAKKDPAAKKEPVDPAPTPAPPPAATPAPAPAPGPAVKDKRRVIGILDVRIDGATPEVGAQFQKALGDQVDMKHYFLAQKSRMRDLMQNSTKFTEGCVVGPCLKDVKTQTNADIVLLAALTGQGTSFGWVVTLVRTDTGGVLAQKSERCDVCTISEAVNDATLATADLLNGIPDDLPDEHPQVIVAPSTKPFEAKISHMDHARHVTGAVLTVTGLAAVAAGIGLYYTQDHANYGLATAGAGAGLALGGVLVLAF